MAKITVHTQGIVCEYPDDHDVSVTPAGVLVVTKLVPDVGNQNNGNPTPKIVALYATEGWEKVELDD